MKVALVYDRINKWGGAERVLLALHKIFPGATLYTSVYNEKRAPWARVFKIKYSFLQNVPFAASMHEYLATAMPIAFESFNFDGYDLVISITSESAKGIITKPGTMHICYCLTPTRYLWSGYKDYFRSPVLRLISKPVVSYLKNWDTIAANRPDKYIAISNEVKQRIKKYYKKEALVIYPPVELSSNTQSPSQNTDKYFLIVSRLSNYYKRIDIAIEACNKLKLPLKIVGTGRDEYRLKKMAGSTIEFLGELTDEKLIFCYENCQALIFPGLEDFGLTMVEAQSFGKPVIAYRGGGALEIIQEGITGDFFDHQSSGSLMNVLEKFNYKSYNIELSRKNALRFSFENFKKQFLEVTNLSLKDL